MRRDLQQLKAVTKCKNCGEVGHWHRECPKKSQAQSGQPNAQSHNASGNQPSSHSWWSLVQPADSSEVHPSVGVTGSLQSDVHEPNAEEETCPMFIWNADELVSPNSRFMGYKPITPNETSCPTCHALEIQWKSQLQECICTTTPRALC